MPRYDAAAGLVVTDVQNDFADPKGNLYVAGGEEIVPMINGEIRLAVASGALVVYTQDWHPESTPHFAKDGGVWPVHCVAGTWGAWLHPDLMLEGDVVRKGAGDQDGYSGFSVRHARTGRRERTELAGILREARIDRVVIAGLATDYCVKETALDAIRLGFRTEVIQAASRAVERRPGDGDLAFEEMRAAGAFLL